LTSVDRLGFWSAALTAALAAAFFGIGVFGTPYTASFHYPYVVSSINPVDYAWLYPALLMAPAVVILMVCVNRNAPEERRVFSQIALSFALVYAAIITADYFTQWTVVLPSMSAGEMEGLSLFTQYNPHGFFVALESLAYLTLNASLLFAAPVFHGGRLERGIRWLFVVSFVLAVGSFAALSLLGYNIVVFEVTIIAIDCVVLMASGTMLSVLFRRAGRS